MSSPAGNLDSTRASSVDGTREPESVSAADFLPALYDFALRTTLDASAAAGVCATVLERAIDDETARRGQHASFHAWLFGLGRSEALDSMRQRNWPDAPSGDEEPVTGQVSASDRRFFEPSSPGQDTELSMWAWQAARGQRPRDYSLLDLSLRRGISDEEVAEIASLSRTAVHAVLGRLRAALEEAFATSVLFFRGRETCPELAAVVGDNNSVPGPSMRREIARHAELCATCRGTREALPPAAGLLAQLKDVQPAEEVTRQAQRGNGASAATAAAGLIPGAAALAGMGVAAAEDVAGKPGSAGGVAPPARAETIVPQTAPADERTAAEALPGPPESETAAEGDAAAAGALPATAVSGRSSGENGKGAADTTGRTVRADEPEGDAPKTPGSDLNPAAVTVLSAGGGVAASTGGELPPLRRIPPGGIITGPPRPPARPWDRFQDDSGGRGRLFLMAALLVAAAAVIYIGVALGDSIRGGGGGSSNAGLPVLPTKVSGVQELSCTSGSVTIDSGSRANLIFDAPALGGFQVADVAVQPVPPASAQSVTVRAQADRSVLFEAGSRNTGSSAREQYNLNVNFARDSERTSSRCTVFVQAPATPEPRPSATVEPTREATAAPRSEVVLSTPQATASTPTPTATPTPAPTATPVPTQVPPTPVPPTPTLEPTPVPPPPPPPPLTYCEELATRGYANAAERDYFFRYCR